MKMTFLRNKISKALKHPKPALDYVFRVWKLSKLLPEYKQELREFFKEAGKVRDEVEALFNPYTYGDPNLEVRLLAPSVIYSVVRAVKPEIVVETGVCNGISAYFILNALERNDCGSLYSIDIEETVGSNRFKEEKKTGWLVPEKLSPRWNFLLGDSKEVLPGILSELKSVDIFLHDGAHTYEYMDFEFRTAWRYLSGSGVLLSDDVYMNKAFEDFIKEVNPSHVATFALLGALRK